MQVLQSSRLLLRSMEQNDLPDVAAWYAEPYLDYESAQKFLNFCAEQYATCGLGPFGIALKQGGRLIGNCGFWRIDSKSGVGDIKCFVSPFFRRCGVGSEATRLLAEFGFYRLGLLRIQGQCESSNVAWERMMQKAGMTPVNAVSTLQDCAQPGRNKFYGLDLQRLQKQSLTV